MSRWNEVITFLAPVEAYQDSMGAWHEGERRERKVFCNVGTIGIMTMAQLRSSEVRITNGRSVPDVGMRDMHVVYVRQIDYEGEDQCLFRGAEMDVIAATSEGANYKIIIRRNIGND